MSEDRFKSQVIATLSKRAANQCSNPDCGTTTSGPSDDVQRSINVGEAAHIYGANPGSARFDPDMLPADRSDITNAIWLCRICHKLVDDDEARFEAGLLFEWRREHEARVSEQVGKPGNHARERFLKRRLSDFPGLSYLAEQIVIDKPDFWEYKLTSEILRTQAGPTIKRWNSLKRGLYLKPIRLIPKTETIDWVLARNQELLLILEAYTEIINNEFETAWGELGTPGSDTDIFRVCGLFSEACGSALAWEEDVRFVRLASEFQEMHEVLIGTAGLFLEEAAKIPEYMSKFIETDDIAPGTYELLLKFELPDQWAERCTSAMERGVAEAFHTD